MLGLGNFGHLVKGTSHAWPALVQTARPVALRGKHVETRPIAVDPFNRSPSPMRICIFGAGAVGSHFAVRLALSGHDVSCVMRGPHLNAVKAKGLTLRVGDASLNAKVKASDDPATLGAQDLVISTLKATGVSSLAAGLRPLLGEDTPVVFAQNGIPCWYDIGRAADHPPQPDLRSLDPGGR